MKMKIWGYFGKLENVKTTFLVYNNYCSALVVLQKALESIKIMLDNLDGCF